MPQEESAPGVATAPASDGGGSHGEGAGGEANPASGSPSSPFEPAPISANDGGGDLPGDSEGNEGGGESEKEKVNDMLVEVESDDELDSQLELVPPSQPAPVLPDSSSRQTASEEEAEPEPIEIADSDLMYTYEDKKLPLHPTETTPQKKTVEDIPEGKTLVPGTIDWLEAQLATLHQEQEVLNLNLSFKVCCLVFGSWDVNVTCFFYVRVGFFCF